MVFCGNFFFNLETQMLQFHGSVELPAQSVPLLSQHWDCPVAGWYREVSYKHKIKILLNALGSVWTKEPA